MYLYKRVPGQLPSCVMGILPPDLWGKSWIWKPILIHWLKLHTTYLGTQLPTLYWGSQADTTQHMMRLWHGSAFHVTGPLWGESTGHLGSAFHITGPFVKGIHRWLVDSLHKGPVMGGFWCFLLLLACTGCWTNSWVDDYFRSLYAHGMSLWWEAHLRVWH